MELVPKKQQEYMKRVDIKDVQRLNDWDDNAIIWRCPSCDFCNVAYRSINESCFHLKSCQGKAFVYGPVDEYGFRHLERGSKNCNNTKFQHQLGKGPAPASLWPNYGPNEKIIP